SPTMFAQQLDQLKLPPDLSSQLKQQYQVASAQDSQIPIQPAAAQTPAEKVQQFVDRLVKQGYIIRNGSYYETVITINKTVIKVNGKELNPLLAIGGMLPGPDISAPTAPLGAPPSTTPGANTYPAKSTLQQPASMPAPSTTLTPASRPAPLTAPAPST